MMDHLVALKNEQTARIVLRDTALYVYLGAIFAVYAAEGQAGTNAALVELIRASSTALSAIMFSIYLSNDYYVTQIGRFVAECANDVEFTRWERSHRVGLLYHAQRGFRTLVVLVLFGGWALFQSIPVFEGGSQFTRLVTVFFGAVVAVQIVMFLRLSMRTEPPRATSPRVRGDS